MRLMILSPSCACRAASELYARVLAITDFVSGMTDSYTVAVVAKLRGLT
jgi:dGTP triphosphohydrolase